MRLWEEIEADISRCTGRAVQLAAPDSVGGGCINQTYRLRAGDGDYFVKLNDASGLDMFEAEAEGLVELGRSGALRVPQPVCRGLSGGQAYLVMECLDLGGRGDAGALGEGLAALHRRTAERFGWHRDNTIGLTPQHNDACDDWVEFFREHRLGFLPGAAQHHEVICETSVLIVRVAQQNIQTMQVQIRHQGCCSSDSPAGH